MSVSIRLSRFGRLHRPYFRIVAIDGRCHREGKANQIIGSYDPLLKEKNLQVDLVAVESWVNRGAQISTGLRNLLKFSGYQVPTPKKTAAQAAAAPAAKTPAKPVAKGTFRPATRRSLRKHAAKLKGVRKAALAAEAAAKADKAAAPAADVAAILLQILDDGRVTDSKGRTVDFRHAIVILTSNADAAELDLFIRPELLNRIDDIVRFSSLDLADIGAIVELQMHEVAKRLGALHITIALSEPAREFLAKESVAAGSGARYVARTIARHVTTLRGDIKEGGSAKVELRGEMIDVIAA